MTWLGFIPLTLAILWLWRRQVTREESLQNRAKFIADNAEIIRSTIMDKFVPAFEAWKASDDPAARAKTDADMADAVDRMKALLNATPFIEEAADTLDPGVGA